MARKFTLGSPPRLAFHRSSRGPRPRAPFLRAAANASGTEADQSSHPLPDRAVEVVCTEQTPAPTADATERGVERTAAFVAWCAETRVLQHRHALILPSRWPMRQPRSVPGGVDDSTGREPPQESLGSLRRKARSQGEQSHQSSGTLFVPCCPFASATPSEWIWTVPGRLRHR
jgi:hypothetical protein